MGRTLKDSSSSQGRYIDVVLRDDGGYDLFFNRKLIGGKMDERSLRYKLCVGYGYCQGEDDLILLEVNRDGRTRRTF